MSMQSSRVGVESKDLSAPISPLGIPEKCVDVMSYLSSIRCVGFASQCTHHLAAPAVNWLIMTHCPPRILSSWQCGCSPLDLSLALLVSPACPDLPGDNGAALLRRPCDSASVTSWEESRPPFHTEKERLTSHNPISGSRLDDCSRHKLCHLGRAQFMVSVQRLTYPPTTTNSTSSPSNLHGTPLALETDTLFHSLPKTQLLFSSTFIDLAIGCDFCYDLRVDLSFNRFTSAVFFCISQWYFLMNLLKRFTKIKVVRKHVDPPGFEPGNPWIHTRP